MADILHRVGMAAPPEDVFRALTTIEGLSGWWTREVKGDPRLGGRLQFFFGRPEPSAVMEITKLDPAHQVAWRCVAGPEEWVGTTLTFDIHASTDETVLSFKHSWREPVEFMYHCSTKWAYFLMSLKEGLEGGEATPYPDDMKISSWG